MTVTLGAGAIGAVYLGATPAEKVYLGADLVWSAGPPQPPPGMSAWWDVASLAGLADGAPVTSWVDKSGNGNTLTTLTNSPTWDATNRQVAFSGSQFLANGSYTGGMADAAPYTMVCSSADDGSVSRGGIVSTNHVGQNGASLSWDGAPTKVLGLHGGVSSSTRTAMTPGIMWMRWDGTNITVGGGTTAASVTTAVGSIVASDRIVLGAERYNKVLPLIGRIGSVAIYPSALNSTDLAAVIAAL